MNLSAPFIRRPIATVLLTAGLALAGVGALFVLPVAPLPNVEFPGVIVQAQLAGASPANMATSIATPLERRLAVISGVNEITSSSVTGQTRINLQFDLSKNVDAAAREVQAAINAARADLPTDLRQNPTYRKLNAATAPVVILALTSNSRTPGQIYDAASNILQQRLSQLPGVGDVTLGGSSLPAVRVELNPYRLNAFGLSGEDVRAAVQAAAAERPRGAIDDGDRRLQIYTNQPGHTAADFRDLVIAWRNGAPVRLKDVAQVVDGVQDVRTLGLFNGRPAIVAIITQQAGANIIRVVDEIMAELPSLRAQLPGDIDIAVASDATTTIRASLREIEVTLLISIALVILVVSAFLRSTRATFIPAVATVVSLLGTLAGMYLLGFSLNNFSLMALTVATGFVVDDAIVVLENTTRHLEAGMGRFEAALLGAREVGFTVVSISLSLVAVFIPLLFMGGLAGRLFREFAVTLSAAVMISLVLSLTTTPMMCAWLLRREAARRPPNRISRWAEGAWTRVLRTYEVSLDWALGHKALVMLILAAVVGLNVYLFAAAPKGFFPTQDSRRLNGGLRADQSISARAMGVKLMQLQRIILHDPAVQTVAGFTGGGQPGGGFLAVQLKPPGDRPGHVTGQQVIQRLRRPLSRVTGVSLFLNPQQDVRMGVRSSNALYQYSLKSDNAAALRTWTVRLTQALKSEPALTDIDNDVQDNGVEAYVTIDRDTASRVGVTPLQIDNVLYDSFGQRQVATLYEDVNQYAVVQENGPEANQAPVDIHAVHASTSSTTTATTPQTTGGLAPLAPAFGAIALPSPVQAPSNAIARQFTPLSGPATSSSYSAARGATVRTPSATISMTPSATPYETARSSLPTQTAVTGTAAAGAANTTSSGSGPVSLNGQLSQTASGVYSAGSVGAAGATSGALAGLNSTLTTTLANAAGATPTSSTAPLAATGAPSSSSISGAAVANPGLRNSAAGQGVSTTFEQMTPLPALATIREDAVPATVNHQDAQLAGTISFNLAPGYSLSDAEHAFADAEARIAMPSNVRGSFQGTARLAQQQNASEPMLIAAALIAIYVLLGILYESLIHPITVLSTLPSAGVGAVYALLLFHMEFTIIALIGVFLLIGIVKKNAILIIDFALEAERSRGLNSTEAVREACLMRFRPILMTTLAAGLGALPLAIGFGEGSELRQPLGVAIIGGLIASQLLTLLTTPVVYVYLDRLRPRGRDERFLSRLGALGPGPPPAQRPV